MIENHLVRLAEEDAGKFGAMKKRLDEREERLFEREKDFARVFRDSSSLICDGCDVPLSGGHVAVRLVNTNVDYCVECMQVGCTVVDTSVAELPAADRRADAEMVGRGLRSAFEMRRRQLDVGGLLFRGDAVGQPPEDMEEEPLATIPEEEIEATDIGPPDDPNTPKRSSSRPPGSQQSSGQTHDGGPQTGGRGNQQTGGRVRDGGPRSGGQAKSEKKLAKKARQRKAKQHRTISDLVKPGRGLVEEAAD